MMDDIDVVIAYVDQNDQCWRKQFEETLQNQKFTTISSKRYRSYNLLETQLQLIRHHMPFVKNIFLLCCLPSQFPACVDKYGVKKVLHAEVIPEQFLPTFQSNTIEMFLHRIPGLSEHYIYFNDDMFPISRCSVEDFFFDGKPVISFKKKFYDAQHMFRMFVKNSWNLAYKIACNGQTDYYTYPKHNPSSFLKSYCNELYDKAKHEIFKSISKIRMPFNYNQYLFQDYMYLKGACHEVDDIKFKYLTLQDVVNGFTDFNSLNGIKTICLNDVADSRLDEEETFNKVTKAIAASLEKTMV